MKRKIHKWTNAEDKVLIGLYEDGVKCTEIAKVLNVKPRQVGGRVYYLRKKGIINTRHSIRWTPELEKELVTILQKNSGNLHEGFRIFAEAHNCDWKCAAAHYYHRDTRGGRIKDKYPIFATFGRYRASGNSKIYSKKESKGHNFWTMIKKIFN